MIELTPCNTHYYFDDVDGYFAGDDYDDDDFVRGRCEDEYDDDVEGDDAGYHGY